MDQVECRVVDAPSEATLEAVRRELREFNRPFNAERWAAMDLPENAPRPLHVVAFDANGGVAGGLIGETEFAWLEVSILAVRPALRGAGIGRRIMEAAEDEARRRGCRHAVLDTMDYQAPRFYERVGYVQAGRFEDWDSRGHAKLFFTKRLV